MEDKNSILRISNVLNLTRQEFSVIEKHIFLFTLLFLKEKQGFNVSLGSDLEAILIEFNAKELKETNRERIKDALDKITSRKIHFDNSNKDKQYFGYVVPFSYANYSAVNGAESKITIHLNPICKKLFFELASGYTEADLKAILNLKSTYTIRMYELMTQYLNQKSWMVEVDKLKNLLGLELNKYKSFTDFETRILTYAQKELWEHCHIHFTWEIAKKERKKITALTFYIESKKKQEKIELNQDIKQTIDFIKQLSPKDIAQKYHLIATAYSLTPAQVDYIVSDRTVFNEFIRVDMIIDDMITKGKPPKDRTAYMAKSLGLDKITFRAKKINFRTNLFL